MKIVLLVIAKNELKNIKHFYKSIDDVCKKYKVIQYFIDANSNDGTLEFLSSKKANVIQQLHSGRGGAILSGFELVKSDAYIVYSPDGNEDIRDLPKFLKFLHEGYDLVIASRMMKESFNEEDDNIFKLRKWVNNIFNFFANFFFNKSKNYVTDSINGFRAVTKKTISTIKLDAYDYTIEYQMSIRCMKSGLSIKEFPTIEGQRKFGVTGAPSFKTGLAFIKRFIMEVFK